MPDKHKIKIPSIPQDLAEEVIAMIESGINRPGGTFFDGLRAIYDGIEKFNQFVKTFTVCRKGCSWCCNYDVFISGLEAYYLAFEQGIQIDTHRTITVHHHSPCPFLDLDGSCSVYRSRPLNCRTLHTLDSPHYCKTGNATHEIYGSAGHGYGNDIYAQVAGWIKLVNEKQAMPYRDIRDWFHQDNEKINIKLIT